MVSMSPLSHFPALEITWMVGIFVFFIMTVAAAEVAVGLALLVALYKKRKSVFTDDMALLKN